MNKYYNSRWSDVVEGLKSDVDKGLSVNECVIRRNELGSNKINLFTGNGTIYQILKELKKIYIISSILTLGIFIFYDKFIYALMVLFSLVLTIIKKSYVIRKKEEDLKYIDKINKTNVEVIREGKNVIVQAEELVVGDIVNFKKGSLIGADIRIIESNDLKVDDSNVTGENFLKEKYENILEGRVSNIGEIKNMLFKGEIVKKGSGSGIVVEVGNKTSLGKLLGILKYGDTYKHKFEHEIEKKISRVYLINVLAFGIITFLLNYDFDKKVIFNSLLALNIIPFSVVLVVFIKVIKERYKKHGINIKNISSLYELGNLEIFLIDKIGAVTKNEMIIKKLCTDNKIYDVNDIDYNNINIKRAIDILLLSNNSTYNVENNTGNGSIEEIAILRWGSKNKVYKSILDSENRRRYEIPIDSDKNFLTTITKSKKGWRANIKGNVDQILDRCTHIMVDGIEKQITNEEFEKIIAIDFNLSREGLVTNGIAYRSFSYEPTVDENIESNLVFVGIVAFENPLKENINDKIIQMKKKGIIPILFTEDNKITGSTIGKKIGIISSDNEVISGIELDSLDRNEIINVLSRVRVFSRVNPEIKSKIVRMFTQNKYKVLTTGEGLGDLPSISFSKVGISKGRASILVQKVSDIFIYDDYLDKIMRLYNDRDEIIFSIVEIFKFYIFSIVLELILINILDVNFGWIVLSSIGIILSIYWRLFIKIKENSKISFVLRGVVLVFIGYLLVEKLNLNPNLSFLAVTLGLGSIFNIKDANLIRFNLKLKRNKNMNGE